MISWDEMMSHNDAARDRVNALISSEPLNEIESIALAAMLIQQGTSLMRKSHGDTDALEFLSAMIADIKDSHS